MMRIVGGLLCWAVLVAAAGVPAMAQSPAGSSPSPAEHADALAAKSAQGAAAMQAGQYDEAAAIYTELVDNRPADPGLLLNLGMARYMAGHPDQAIPSLRKALALQPALPPASLFLGASLLALGRAKEAAPPLQRAVAAMPQNADAREMLARAKLALSDFASATTHYDRLTQLDAQSAKAWYGLSRSYQGMAEEAFTRLQQQSADSPLLELLIAEVASTENKFAAALRIYRRALAGSPAVGGIHEAVAELYDRAGKPEWAAQELEKAPARSDARCAARRAECLFLDGKFREALGAARQVKTPVGLYWTIRAANRLATECVAKLETLPPSIELHLIRAEIAQAQGRRAEAVTEIREALALAPGDFMIETALAEALVRANNAAEALPLLERLLREHPDAGSLAFLYGDALLASQRIDEAIQALERAVKADPTASAPRAALGRAYVQAGRFQEALPHLEAAAAEDDDGDIHYQLARAYQALQRTDEARTAMAEYQKRHVPASETEPAGGTGDDTLTPP
jgi:predicted Zn-dependent protease